MWEEVARRYQQILHREYRMMNLPFYPVEGGNVYLYYVPVIINQGPTTQYPGVNIEHQNTRAAVSESRKEKEDVIYINDSDDDSICSVKEEPSELAESCSFGKSTKVESPHETMSPNLEKMQYDNNLSTKWEETTIQAIESFDYTEHKQLSKSSSDKRDDPKTSNDCKNTQDQTQYDQCDESNIQVTEDHIRIFKGYTIEYHPLYRNSSVNQRDSPHGAQQYTDRDEKIQDLKKRLAEHKVELEKLKLQQSVKGGVSRNGHLDEISPQNMKDRYINGEISECCKYSRGRGVRDFLKDCPSTQIHYFPSGERKTILPRKNSRKQTSPRRIDALSNIRNVRKADDKETIQTEITINNLVLKRKLTPPTEKAKERPREDKKAKRTHCSEKTKVRTRRKGGQRRSPTSSPNLKKGSQSMYGKSQLELTCVSNLDKAAMPEDISQEEFLSLFGLLRMNENKGETLLV